MVTAVSSSTILPSVQPASATGTSGAATQPATTTPTAANDTKLQAAKTALSAMTGSKKGTVAGRAAAKADALKKLDALKQRLKALMLMGGDPKTVAKQAAQIAKQIAQVAKDYAAAGGTGASAVAPATPAAPTAAASDSTAQAPGDGTDAQSADQTADATATDGTGAPANGGAQQPQETPAQPPPAPAQSSAPSPPDSDSEKGDKRQPDLVIAEAKIFAATAKSIMKAAIARAQHEHAANPSELADDQATMKQADKDIAEADKAVNGDDTATGYSSGGQAVASSADVTSVSVQA